MVQLSNTYCKTHKTEDWFTGRQGSTSDIQALEGKNNINPLPANVENMVRSYTEVDGGTFQYLL